MSRTPILAGDFVTLAKTNGPCLLVAAVEPVTGMAWVSYREDGDVRTALLPLEDLRPYSA